MERNSSSSKNEHAKNEKRDSEGRFESTDRKEKDSKTTPSSKSSQQTKNEKKESHGRSMSGSKK